MNAIEALEELVSTINIKFDEHEHSLSELHDRYESGQWYSNEDTAMIDYHEGATEALGVIQFKAQELFKGVTA